MRKAFNKNSDIYLRFLFWIIFFALFTIFLLGRRTEFRLSHDFSSYLLPAFGESQGHGNLYVDYYINRPPMIFLLIKIWGSTFGWRYSSWVLLEIFCLLSVSLSVHLIAKEFLHSASARLLTLIFVLTLLFSDITSMFLTSEIIALSFISLATVLLVANADLDKWTVIVSSALFTFSALIREQFALVSISLIFVLAGMALLRRCKYVAILQALLGSSIVLISAAVYLFLNQNIVSFFNIFLSTYRNKRVGFLRYGVFTLDVLTKLRDYFYFAGITNC